MFGIKNQHISRPIFMHKLKRLKQLMLHRRARCAYATLTNKQRNKQTSKPVSKQQQKQKREEKKGNTTTRAAKQKANKQPSSHYMRMTMKRFCLVMNTHQLHL